MGRLFSVNIPFFIKMKELPQMQAKIINKTQLFVVVDMEIKVVYFF
jgi:hypothetical protein